MNILLILLSIIKVISIIVGVIASIAIMILVMILFVPFKYSFHVEKTDTMRGKYDIWWLFKLFQVSVQNSSEGTGFRFRILLKTISRAQDNQYYGNRDHSDGVQPNLSQTKPKGENPISSEGKKEKPAETFQNAEKKQTIKKEQPSNTIKEKARTSKQAKPSPEEKDEKKPNMKRNFIHSIHKILEYPHKKIILKHSYRTLKKLICHIFPEELYVKGIFGLEDPADTGMVLGVLHMLFGYLGQPVSIKGNFQEQEIKGVISGKGKIRVATILFIIFQFLLDKTVRELVRKILRERKGADYGS